jgi:hypothetical protein
MVRPQCNAPTHPHDTQPVRTRTRLPRHSHLATVSIATGHDQRRSDRSRARRSFQRGRSLKKPAEPSTGPLARLRTLRAGFTGAARCAGRAAERLASAPVAAIMVGFIRCPKLSGSGYTTATVRTQRGRSR